MLMKSVTNPTPWTNMIDSTPKKVKIIMMQSMLKKQKTNYIATPHLTIEDKTMMTMRRDIFKEESMIATKTIENQTKDSLKMIL